LPESWPEEFTGSSSPAQLLRLTAEEEVWAVAAGRGAAELVVGRATSTAPATRASRPADVAIHVSRVMTPELMVSNLN
jgi:hypothetical protein